MSEQLEAMQFLMDSHSKLMVEIERKDAVIAELHQKIIDCRDDILNGRGPLEIVLDNDQTNAVLAVFDDRFIAEYDTTKEPS